MARNIKRPFVVSALLGLLLTSPLLHATEKWSRTGWDHAFARRNYRLGMTLSEFRAQKFPDQKYSPGAYAVCSNDPKAADWRYAYSQISDGLKKAGVIKCHYYFFSSLTNRLESAELLAADWGTSTDFYFIKPQGAANYFLYKIISTSGQPIFTQLVQAYTAAMGKPPTIQKTPVENRLGATFENVIASWENTVSRIRLEKYYLDLDTLGIILTLKPLTQIVASRMSAVAKERAGRL